jgi:SAM-dependent methyltransferase
VSEFTGERVIPGQVNTDLWNEHYSRYAFAARYAKVAIVLDLGCGTGYGAAELALHADQVTGVDISQEAVTYAREHFPLPNLQFARASCTALPCGDPRFDLITAFEVIEHLKDWPALISEAGRVLKHEGIFLVSTPNKLCYADSRKLDGPNPFHEHEFEAEEFAAALDKTFQYVSVLLQNRSECLAFYPPGTFWPAEARIDSSAGGAEGASFFIAICSHAPLPEQRSFVYVPRAVNILREREQHIEKLEHELALNQGWLAEVRAERSDLVEHLEEHNRWALQLEKDWRAAQARIVELQDQFHAEQQAGLELARKYDEKVRELERESNEKTEWALETERRLTAEIEHERGQLAETLRQLETAEATVEERTRWALELQRRVDEIEAQLHLIRTSRWIGLGRKFGVGPRV